MTVFPDRDTQSVSTDANGKSKKPVPVEWLPKGTVLASRTLGTTSTTSQVHPEQFTKFILRKFLERPNTNLIIGSATSLSVSPDSQTPEALTVTTVNGEQTLPCSTLVLAAGPWTGRLASKLLTEKAAKHCQVDGQRAHSIVLESKEALSAHALFTDMTLKDGSSAEPEVYCRPDGTAYM
jgi:glycine/D-amino acid oxidase-like deaminating enzyme